MKRKVLYPAKEPRIALTLVKVGFHEYLKIIFRSLLVIWYCVYLKVTLFYNLYRYVIYIVFIHRASNIFDRLSTNCYSSMYVSFKDELCSRTKAAICLPIMLKMSSCNSRQHWISLRAYGSNAVL